MKKLFKILIPITCILSLTACKDAKDLPKEIRLENKIETETSYTKTDESEEIKDSEEPKESEQPNKENSMINDSDFEKAIHLLDKTYEDTKKNSLISPLSLNFALSMVTEGANGQTKELLQKYLNSDNYGDYVRDYMSYTENLNDTYETYDGEYKNIFEIANSVWINDKSEIKKNYKNNISEEYKAEINNFNVEEPETSADKINDWVNGKTHKMIPRIVSPEMIMNTTQSILVNTVYFESGWRNPWNYYEEYKKDFTDISGETKQISYMTGEADSYYENENATAFSYGYKNGLSFIGILPKKEGEFSLSDLDIEGLLNTESSEYTSINVEMPKLDFDTDVNIIKEVMKEDYGMDIIFDDELAEFDGIIEDDILHIDNIIQKCKIELDENGTRATAVTAIFTADNMAMITEQNIKEVFLNRPFAFLIYDKENNQIVFIGKVVNI